MRTVRLTFSILLCAFFLTACNKPGMRGEPGKEGSSLRLGAARIVANNTLLVKSNTEARPVPVFEDSDNGIHLYASASVSPISDEGLKTRAAETTTANLSSFTVQGFLGDEILTCDGASQYDKDNRHFISDAVASKGADNFWHFGSTYKWRSCVDHHFWAYSGTPVDFSVSGDAFDQADFSYVNGGDEDLVIAYQNQMWVDEDDGNGNWPLLGLNFKHALSEVSIDHSPIVFKQFSVTGGEELSPSTRLSVSRVRMITSFNGSCTSSDGSFTWTYGTEDADYMDVECTNPDNTSFVIPQIPSNTVTVLSLFDSYRDVTTPIFIELPSTADVPAWNPGYKYTYQLTGTVCAPYYTPSGELNPDFKGKNFQHFALMNNLLSKYVRKVVITWTGLGYCNSNDTYMALVYVPTGTTPSETEFPLPKKIEDVTWAGNSNVGFLTAVIHNVIQTPVKGSITGGILSDPSSCVCRAEFILPDSVDYPISFYLIYGGDNNGNADWILHNLNIDVTEFKSPVQIVP